VKALAIVMTAIALAGCAAGSGVDITSSSQATSTSSSSLTTRSTTVATVTTVPPAPTTTSSSTTTPPTSTTLPPGVTPPPEWLGTRPLPLDDEGDPMVMPTPDVMMDRRFTSPDVLPPPPTETFTATIASIPDEVLVRSTWEEGCPVALEDLSYLTMAFWGFDQEPHTGEMIVHADVAEEIVGVFETLYEARFPIETMEITSRQDLDAEPTGDGNETSAFACRPVTGSTSGWSQHAYGLAIDINPFHNPYVKGDLVLPELAGAYADRSWVRPGMIVEGDVVTDAFDAIGWGWGGRWTTLSDTQHFSRSGT
jgi:hypothetical protein